MSDNTRLHQLIGGLARQDPALAGAFASLGAKIDMLIEENRAHKAEVERKDATIAELQAWARVHEHASYCARCRGAGNDAEAYCETGRALYVDAYDASTVAALRASPTDNKPEPSEAP